MSKKHIRNRLLYLNEQHRAAHQSLDKLLNTRPLMLDPTFRHWERALGAEKRAISLLADELIRLQRELGAQHQRRRRAA